MLSPWIAPSRTRSVFTEPAACASGASSAHIGITASLCGIVTFTPAKPAASIPATKSASRSGGTSTATYSQSIPSSA